MRLGPKAFRGPNAVRDHIEQLISSGRYRPGAKLPTERALAEQLGVPRGVVRNALAVLESDGLVIRRVGSGTFVTDAAASEPEPTSNGFHDASPAEIMATRILLEPKLAGLAVVHATVADLDAIEECHKAAVLAKSFDEFEYWDAALHQRIAAATHNRLIQSIFAAITRTREQANWGELKQRSLTHERRLRYQEEHSRIVGALRARDAARAEAELLKHLLGVRQNLLGY